ncbi:hypothetical protein EDB81DRAFT_79466 [Dactylonectria macrodidyma]|uniref:Uncharacterized protein n=1 Tax=Dactylonectria macrodidyma TaxID=307937 RepID=A0A9P9EH39_9HYPO|nr:hypothetical protein EDB81DRAFT_79466 [Dactylonectria macrodidyma]
MVQWPSGYYQPVHHCRYLTVRSTFCCCDHCPVPVPSQRRNAAEGRGSRVEVEGPAQVPHRTRLGAKHPALSLLPIHHSSSPITYYPFFVQSTNPPPPLFFLGFYSHLILLGLRLSSLILCFIFLLFSRLPPSQPSARALLFLSSRLQPLRDGSRRVLRKHKQPDRVPNAPSRRTTTPYLAARRPWRPPRHTALPPRTAARPLPLTATLPPSSTSPTKPAIPRPSDRTDTISPYETFGHCCCSQRLSPVSLARVVTGVVMPQRPRP